MQQRGLHVDKVLCEVPRGFRHGAEQGWAFNPAHLHCCRDHQLTRFLASCGRTYAKLKSSSSLTTSRQKPSLMSNLENRMCRPAGVSRMYCKRRGRTLPISLTGTVGAVSTVESFTLCCVTVTTLLTSGTPGTTSNLGYQCQWGYFEVAGPEAFHVVPQHHLAEPGVDLILDIFRERAIASGVHAIGCCPRSISVSITSHDKLGLQSTLMPSRHLCMAGAKGWTSTSGWGCINDRGLP